MGNWENDNRNSGDNVNGRPLNNGNGSNPSPDNNNNRNGQGYGGYNPQGNAGGNGYNGGYGNNGYNSGNRGYNGMPNGHREDLMGMDRVIITTIIITIMDRAITAIIMATEAAEEIIITRRSQRTGIQ